MKKIVLMFYLFFVGSISIYSQNNTTLFKLCEEIVKGQSTTIQFDKNVENITDNKVYFNNTKNSALFFFNRGKMKCLVADNKFSTIEIRFQYNEFIQDEETLESFIQDVYNFIKTDKTKKSDNKINVYSYLDLRSNSRIIDYWSDKEVVYILYTTLNDGIATLSLYMKKVV